MSAPRMRYVVLGSLPGAASLDAGEYYAHPRNAFWPLMQRLFGVDPRLSYARRCAALRARQVGLWDVIASCERAGSLDSAIVAASVRPNPLQPWLAGHPLEAIGLNGATAARLFERQLDAGLASYLEASGTRVLKLPSTSPANAAMGFAAKLARWRELIG